jgi:hypothetical protein
MSRSSIQAEALARAGKTAASLIADLEAEQSHLAVSRDLCDPDDKLPRWDRLQRVIDHLKEVSAPAQSQGEPMAEVHDYDERISFSSEAYNAGFAITLYIDGGQRSTEALDSLNRVLDRPFGTVSLAVRALVFALYQGGYPVQWRHHDGAGWYETPACFTWRGDVCYRVTPAPSLPPAEPKPDGDGQQF